MSKNFTMKIKSVTFDFHGCFFIFGYNEKQLNY